MSVHKYDILAKLIMDESFRRDMATDLDGTIAKSGINADDEFVGRLKKFHAEKGIQNIGELKVNDVHNAMAKDLGLESRW
jgi:hypothetical protein